MSTELCQQSHSLPDTAQILGPAAEDARIWASVNQFQDGQHYIVTAVSKICRVHREFSPFKLSKLSDASFVCGHHPTTLSYILLLPCASALLAVLIDIHPAVVSAWLRFNDSVLLLIAC